MIGIIDYGSGNIGALTNILEHEGLKYKLVSTKTEMVDVEKLILPNNVCSLTEQLSCCLIGLIDVLNFM